MTVHDCLMHMTGLGWGDADRSNMDDFIGAMTKLRGGRDGTLQTMVENLAEFPLVFQPGHALALRRLDRHRRPPRRDDLGAAVRRVPAHARSSSRCR